MQNNTRRNIQKLGHGRRQGDKRCTSVEDDTGVIHLGTVFAKGDSIKINFPVSLAAEGNRGHLAGVVALVDAAKGRHRVVSVLVGIAQIERKDGLIQQVLVEHVVERWDDLVDGDRVISQTQNTVKAAKGKSKTWLARGLREVLVVDFQVANLELVLRNES